MRNIMRIRISKCLSLFIVLINLLLFFVSWKYFKAIDNSSKNNWPDKSMTLKTTTKSTRDRILEANKFLRRSVTIVFRDFYHFDNDIKNCVDHLLNLIPDMRIIVIQDELPYPPMNIFSSLSSNQTSSGTSLIYKDNVQFFHLDFMDFTKTASEKNPLNYIITKYTLFMPDGFRLSNGRQLFQRLIKSLRNNHRKILAVPFTSNNKLINYCFQINSDLPNWTLKYEVKNTTTNCNMV